MKHENANLLNNKLKADFHIFNTEQSGKYNHENVLKIDLHCHDLESDVPDELLGRMLNVPETWLETEKLIEILKKKGVTAYTITNHNNTRSCYNLIKKGFDVLVGCEFSCMVPDFGVGIHVLAYGFNKDQEEKLLIHRKNIYAFQEYACSENIPTIWAHPFYHYTTNKLTNIEFFEKMSLIFERFEILNGQRDIWQNMLMKAWLDDLTETKIDILAEKHAVQLSKYCRNPYKKVGTGGSDSHIGLFAGETGTYLYVENLKERLQNEKASALALEALRTCNVAVYGSFNNDEKLCISFLDYVCQVAMYRKDPGLLRILLHKGKTQDKLLAFIVSNAFAELQHHKTTMRFIKLFHESLMGVRPSRAKRLLVPTNYKSVFDKAVEMSKYGQKDDDSKVRKYHNAIKDIYIMFNNILFHRIEKKITGFKQNSENESIDLNSIINHFELPSEIRDIVSKKSGGKKRISGLNLTETLDGLSFPFLASGLILAAHYTSAKVLYNNRKVLNLISEKLNIYRHKKRLLWMSDTFGDNNGVSFFLKSLLKEIQERNLPIDILVCSNTVEPEANLIVVKPVSELKLPFYESQVLHIPSFLEIHQLFQHNEYDRIMCSTEGPLGLMAIYLKNAFTVEASFYVHTDWITFARTTLNIDKQNISRLRRLIRAYYKTFDNIFVLNSEQRKWFTGRKMDFISEKTHQTAHWVDAYFKPVKPQKEYLFGVRSHEPILLFVGRVSYEKGIKDIETMYFEVKKNIPEVKLVVAGTGPAEKYLMKKIPEAIFLGWVKHEELPQIYASSDLLILPSHFDTFSFVVLEAMSCGLPVVAYNTKGPKDLIDHEENGFLANDNSVMSEYITYYLQNPQLHKNFKSKAISKSEQYSATQIIKRLLINVGLENESE